MKSFKRIHAGVIRIYTVSNDHTKRGGSVPLFGVNLPSLFLLKQSEADISPVMSVKSFLPVIVVFSSPDQYSRTELKPVERIHQHQWQFNCHLG